MNIDQFGRVHITDQEAFDALYSGKIKSLENIFIDGNIDQYNHSRLLNADKISELTAITDLCNITLEEFDQSNQQHWFMPKNYCSNLLEDLYNKCINQEQKNRVTQELELYMQYGMIDLLFYLKYLVDKMRENNIVWGVGRGSSVASYVLYLIGVHRIDSIKYNLDIREFLKEK